MRRIETPREADVVAIAAELRRLIDRLPEERCA
jgi:hypothetical protein